MFYIWTNWKKTVFPNCCFISLASFYLTLPFLLFLNHCIVWKKIQEERENIYVSAYILQYQMLIQKHIIYSSICSIVLVIEIIHLNPKLGGGGEAISRSNSLSKTIERTNFPEVHPIVIIFRCTGNSQSAEVWAKLADQGPHVWIYCQSVSYISCNHSPWWWLHERNIFESFCPAEKGLCYVCSAWPWEK